MRILGYDKIRVNKKSAPNLPTPVPLRESTDMPPKIDIAHLLVE